MQVKPNDTRQRNSVGRLSRICHHGQMRDFGFAVAQRYKVHLPKAEQFICDGSYESVKFGNSDNKLVALIHFQKSPNRIVGGGGFKSPSGFSCAIVKPLKTGS